MRDPEATRRRLLSAGTAEFAAYGIAGARVDRIADAAGCNKQSIYGHFESKDGLFDAVFDAMVTRIVRDVPFDPSDLPTYAAQMFDWSQANPEMVRLSTWQQLERGGISELVGVAAEVTVEKVAKLRRAQDSGKVTQSIPAEQLLMFIYQLSTVQPHGSGGNVNESALMRSALVEAVRRLVST